ncbi:ROK family protein [Rhodobium gokarnense]|uniref:NBD/HSP70 family sugar kinase n=1 Tax=Rhodobium gokarnense TaxID=364296 RepID=A0ABT3HHC1_9HYPH|nr:ROK family protein [Rhodobium gokarnense]MCW2309810.1 putative NBD/HSP70 family sugar kinase [Rhodobium gokarnense]
MSYRTVKADSETVRRQNRHLILDRVRRHGSVSRTWLAASTQLSSATISAITGDLIAEGALIEARGKRPAGTPRGRPQVRLKLNPDFARVVGVLASVEEIGVVVADYSGATVASRKTSIAGARLGARETVEAIAGEIEAALAAENIPLGAVRRQVVAVQGIVDASRQRLLWTPFSTVRDINLAEPLGARLGVPTSVVNDCATMVEGLHWGEPDRYSGDFVVVLVGCGVGMGLYLNGRNFSGWRSSAAELGHTIHRPEGALCRCGRHGCIEAYSGDYAIWRTANGLDPKTNPAFINPSAEEMADLAARARAGDDAALLAFRDAGTALGHGLARVFALVDPRKIVFTGTGMPYFDLLEPHIRRGYDDGLVEALFYPLEFDLVADETALVFKGTVMDALSALDRDISRAAHAAAIPAADRNASSLS